MKLQGKKVLVTGGAGFIGSHLVEALVAEGCEVTVLDNLSSGNPANLAAVRDRIDFIEKDVRRFEDVSRAAEGCDVIFHLAALVSVPESVAKPIESAWVNDIGTLHALEAARVNGGARFVFAGSSAIYGDDPEIPKNEAMIPLPLTPYAAHKMAGEYYARIYTHLYGIGTVCLRFFNVYGPRQDPSSPYSGVISIFMDKAVSDAAPTIYGDGSQTRDFVYVRDVVGAVMRAAVVPDIAGQSFNIGTGTATTVEQLWQSIRALARLDVAPNYAPARSGDILHSVADIDRAKTLLGFVPEISLEEGLRRTLQWHTTT